MWGHAQELQRRCNAVPTNGVMSSAGLPEFNTLAPNEDVSGSHNVTENPLFGEVWLHCAFLLSLLEVFLL